MARRKHKPKTPEQIALDKATAKAAQKAADARGEFGVDETAMALPANAEVVVLKNHNGKGVQTARRGDIFDRLLNDGQLRAVRRLEADIAEQMGHTWRPGQRVTVDSCQYPPGQNVSQGQIEAGKRVAQARSMMGARCGWLLIDLITRKEVGGKPHDPHAPAPVEAAPPFDWRAVVEYVTGEGNEQAQGARVRAAADNLAGAYEDIEKARKRHAIRTAVPTKTPSMAVA